MQTVSILHCTPSYFAALAIQLNSLKIVITNLWTSTNSVYAFAGTVAFWIDDNCNLHKCVLELPPLNGDHSVYLVAFGAKAS